MLADLILLGLFDLGGYETPPERTLIVPLVRATMQFPAKYPDELLDYKLDWTKRLASDEIAAVRLGVTSGVVVATRVIFDAATVSLFIGAGRSGNGSIIECLVTTRGGRKLEEQISIYCL